MFHSSIPSWCAQRISSFGLVALLCLLYLSLWPSRYGDLFGIRNSQMILIWYTTLVHILGFAFPLRLCYATWRLTNSLKETGIKRGERTEPWRSSASNEKERLKVFNGSDTSSDHSSGYEAAEADTESCDGGREDEMVIHTIIVPNYKEDIDTLRETLEVLACHPKARLTYEVCLAMEQGEEGSGSKASTLIAEFAKFFRSVYYTRHPRGIDGEAQGKSSNLCWAARYVNMKYEDQEMKRNMIVTVIDADSYLSTRYFTSLTNLHLLHTETATTTIYVPPIIFDRNAHAVPMLIRVADLLWSGAGMSGHYKNTSICPPTSVYSLSLTLVDQVGGWDVGDSAIGEDLHMYIKCFFAVNGNLTTRTIMSAASQSNVHCSSRGIRGLFLNLNARYRQALRHMWGALDSGYVVKSIAVMCWKDFKGFSDQRPNYSRTAILLHRMFEAHFLPTHITLILLTTTIYTLFTPKSQIPSPLLQTLLIAGYMRFLSFLAFAGFFILYESFHNTCLKARKAEMVDAGLSGKMEGSFSYRNSWRRNVVDFMTFPITGIIFGSVPTVVAQLCHFWTLSLVYKVSKKPERKGSANL